jgi:type VI secretion system protein ImpA
MDASELLTPLDPHAPCGVDLEYDPTFLALQQAAVGKSEQQFGTTIIPAEAPDWREVEKLSLGLMQRTYDIRVIGFLTQAWTESRGLAGYAEGLNLVAEALARYWEEVHPQVVIDGDEDPMPRVNALSALGDVQGAGRRARSSRLLNSVHGQLSLRDAEAILDGGRTDSEAYPGGRARLLENLRQGWLARDPDLVAVSDALAALKRIQSIVVDRAGAAWSPDFQSIERTLQCVAQGLTDSVDDSAADDTAAAVLEADTQALSGAPTPHAAAAGNTRAASNARNWLDAEIHTRDEAAAMLVKVASYFETHEPSHPAPYLLRRVQQLVSLNFHDIVKNLAPQGLDQFEAWLPRDADGQPIR